MWASTFLLTCLAWIVFRSRSLSDAGYVVTHLTSGWNFQVIGTPHFLMRQMPIAVAGIVTLEIGQAWRRKVVLPACWASGQRRCGGPLMRRLCSRCCYWESTVERNSSTSNSRIECLMSTVSASVRDARRPVYQRQQFVPDREGGEAARTLRRVGLFLAIIAGLVCGLDATITAGLRRMPTSLYRVTNRIMAGSINARIVISGSSRAASHFDPRVIHKITGYSTFNLGRNGSQTDMQLAVLKTYLKHNRPPEIVVHNLDASHFRPRTRFIILPNTSHI